MDSTQQTPLFMRCAVYRIFYNNNSKTIAAVVALAILNIVTALFATLANVLVIVVYYHNRRLRTIQNTTFLFLSITDVSVSAFVQPLFVTAVIEISLGNQNCLVWDILSYTTFFFLSLSLVTIIILSLQSYISLAYPYNFRSILTVSRLKLKIGFSWLLVTMSTLATIFHPSIYGALALFILTFTIVTVIFTWVYIYKLVARHRKAIQTTQTPSTSEIISQKKILRSTVTAMAVIASISLCYFLDILFLCLKVFANVPWENFSESVVTLSFAAKTLMFLNSLLNPCLVFWRSRDFREEIKVLFPC